MWFANIQDCFKYVKSWMSCRKSNSIFKKKCGIIHLEACVRTGNWCFTLKAIHFGCSYLCWCVKIGRFVFLSKSVIFPQLVEKLFNGDVGPIRDEFRRKSLKFSQLSSSSVPSVVLVRPIMASQAFWVGCNACLAYSLTCYYKSSWFITSQMSRHGKQYQVCRVVASHLCKHGESFAGILDTVP